MFYDPEHPEQSGVKNPIMSGVAPRPIGWVSTQNKDGKVNLAPYSFFNIVCQNPPILMISSEPDAEGGRKETERNIMETGEFVVNVVTWEQHDAMMTTAKYKEQDAITPQLVEHKPSHTVAVPRVAGSPIQFECKLDGYIDKPSESDPRHVRVIFGRVTGVNVDQRVINDKGYIDLEKADLVGATGRPLVRVRDGLQTDPKP
jgi:flavin reductase (DIM6/NTAB) family NADH-FMN oxidoreductase RutF